MNVTITSIGHPHYNGTLVGTADSVVIDPC